MWIHLAHFLWEECKDPNTSKHRFGFFASNVCWFSAVTLLDAQTSKRSRSVEICWVYDSYIAYTDWILNGDLEFTPWQRKYTEYTVNPGLQPRPGVGHPDSKASWIPNPLLTFGSSLCHLNRESLVIFSHQTMRWPVKWQVQIHEFFLKLVNICTRSCYIFSAKRCIFSCNMSLVKWSKWQHTFSFDPVALRTWRRCILVQPKVICTCFLWNNPEETVTRLTLCILKRT